MNNKSYGLTMNGKFEYSLGAEELATFDIIDLGRNKFHLLKDGRSYLAQIENINKESKTILLKVGEQRFEIEIADSYDNLVKQMGLDFKVLHQINEIKAPMPGLVLSMNVTEGQEIKMGDPLFVLEAMKMENVIKSPGEGKVKTILAQKGKPVEKGEILIHLE